MQGSWKARGLTYDALDRPVSAWVPGQLFGSTRVAAQMRYEYKSLGRKTLVTVQEPMAVGGGVAYGASRTIEQLSYDVAGGNGRIGGSAEAVERPEFFFRKNGTMPVKAKLELAVPAGFESAEGRPRDRLLA